MLSLLIVDDDPTARAFLQMHLRGRFEKTFQAETLAEARQILERETVRVVLLDEQLPDGSGLEFFRANQAWLGNTAVIFVTGARDVDLAVSAMRAGARDFLSKPIDPKSLVRTIESVVAAPRATARSNFSGSIVGESPAMNEIWHKVHIFAPTDISVLILGESGTGKELFARALHAGSKRADGPFIELDCASLPPSLLEAELFGHEKGAFTDAREARKGRFELAHGGTLFLDELGNLSLEVQAKLLRVLQERAFRRVGGTKLVEIDVRVIGATNLDLTSAIEKQNFRSDLYYRLAEVSLELPPLRQRDGDVMRLAEHYLEENNRAFGRAVQGFTPEATALLESYSWPGNVRELRNVMRSTTLLAGERAAVEH